MTPDETPTNWNREVLLLCEAIVNGDATADQVERLDQLLADDESARSLYLDYVDIHAGLRRRFLAPEVSPEGQGPDSPGAKAELVNKHGVRVGWLPVLLAMAACLAVVAAPYLLRPSSESLQPAPEGVAAAELPPHASLHGVAVLSRSVGVEWADGANEYEEGSPVPAGELTIQSGVLQIDFYSGAIAVLEGPATLDLVSAEHARLVEGKLRARVPKRATGFTIATRSGDIVDLGTEFAVAAPSGDGPGELHVIDGEVRFHPTKSDETTPVSLRGGEAVWLSDGEQQADPPNRDDSSRFIGPTEVEVLAREDVDARRRAWIEHREELLEDPALAALYGYSPEPGWGRLFRNFAPAGGDDTHGAVVGCRWVAGRWAGHKALSFRNASHRVSVSLPGEFDALTLSTWVVVNQFHPTNSVALLHPELEQDRILHWTLDRVPTGAVLHFSETTQPIDLSNRRHYSSRRQGIFNGDIDRWVHLAVTYNPALKRVSHYRDGELVGWTPIAEPQKLSVGIADIGNWPYKDWAKGTEFEMRNLMGRMDEFVILGRAMSGDEVRTMHAVGAP